MGISQLLPFVAKSCRQGNIDEIKGCSVALDVSCLLHRGLFGGVAATVYGSQNTVYVNYIKKRVDKLLSNGCHVILVFDGRPLPAKKETNDDRNRRRSENMRAGQILLAEGRRQEAIGKLQQAVTITQDVVENTIEFFRAQPLVDVIVSPYESDAQLAFLTKEKLADVVITEDSDLIAFGCEKIVFKWSFDNGQCTIYDREKLPGCFAGEFGSNFDFEKFRRICILSGCDYLQAGLPGVGLSKALTFFTKTSQRDMRKALPKVPSYLKMNKLKVSSSFVEEFIRAENTFLHQVVFDPRSKCQRPLNPYPLANDVKKLGGTKGNDDLELDLDPDDDFIKPKSNPKVSDKDDYKYAGVVSAANLAVRLALGNQEKGQPLLDKFRLPSDVPEWSIWSAKFVTGAKQTEAHEKKKSNQCGAFVLDSPSKRRKKIVKPVSPSATNEKEEIFLGDTPEKIDHRVPPSLEKVVISKTSKRKMFDPVDLSYNEMMLIYGNNELPVESVPDPDSSLSDEKKEETFLPSVAIEIEVESSPSSSQMGTICGQNENTASAIVPLVKRTLSTPSTLKASSKFRSPLVNLSQTAQALSAKVQILPTKSAYFLNRSPACANPFKRHRMELPSPTVQKDEGTAVASVSKPSVLSSLEDADDSTLTTTVTRTHHLPRVGFRPQGLRRSRTK